MVHTNSVSSVRLWMLGVAVASVFLLIAARVNASDPHQQELPSPTATELTAQAEPFAEGATSEEELTDLPTLIVEPGDNLWSLASRVAGSDEDLRSVIQRIRQLNRLDGSMIFPGQHLVIPSSGGK